MLRHQPTSTIHSQHAGSQAFTPQAGSWKEASLGNMTKGQKAILLSMAPLLPASSPQSPLFLPRLRHEQPAKDLQLSRVSPDSTDGGQEKAQHSKRGERRKQRLPRKVAKPIISDPRELEGNTASTEQEQNENNQQDSLELRTSQQKQIQ